MSAIPGNALQGADAGEGKSATEASEHEELASEKRGGCNSPATVLSNAPSSTANTAHSVPPGLTNQSSIGVVGGPRQGQGPGQGPVQGQGEEEEEESDEEEGSRPEEVLEESPCGRYHKRKERVTQRDVPGIDAAYLAMDTDYAVQVVWNEVIFSQRKSSFKPQAAAKIKLVFDNLMLIDHPNIIKVHKYWTTERNEDTPPRLIFITEYMPSRNMKQFLKTTRSQTQKHMSLKVWKRWCVQILSALSYLHSVEPPIIHGNLNCETLFIQHNGLLKIGSIAPDAIHTHVKTCREQQRHFHFIAPEYAGSGGGTSDQPINEAVDIYAFGMCALEMAVHGLLAANGGGENTVVNEELIENTLKTLQTEQAEFIRSCLRTEPKSRPSARELLLTPIIFEVHQLKLLAAHSIINLDLHVQDNFLYKYKRAPSDLFAMIPRKLKTNFYTYAMIPENDVEKLLEDVSHGLFPLTSYIFKKRTEKIARVSSPEESDCLVAGESSEGYEAETRMILSMLCDMTIESGSEIENEKINISLKLKLDDNTTRNLNAQFNKFELPLLSSELVHYGFINEADREKVNDLISKSYTSAVEDNTPSPSSSLTPAASAATVPAASAVHVPTIPVSVPPVQ